MTSELIRTIAAIVTGALSVVYASAADAEAYQLLKHKAWEVNLQESNNQELYCEARVRNGSGDSLHLVGYPDQPLRLFIFLLGNEWNRDFEGDAELDIDYTPWTLNNTEFRNGKADFVKFTFPSGSSTMDFLDELYQGTAIALKSPQRSRTIASFSLAGSAAALVKLSECWTRLPTGQSGDVYGASTRDSYGNRDSY